MKYLADANILLRVNSPGDPHYHMVKTAIQTLIQQGHEICAVPQCYYEMWAVATRPASARSGFGWSFATAETEIARLEIVFSLLPDVSPGLFYEWRRLVNKYGVLGVNAHDARIVAAMLTHGITICLP